jgi:chaperonin GroES
MALKLKPLDDYVVVKPMEGEEKTEGGIVLPDTAKEKPQKGEVLAVGPGKLLKNGDRRPLSLKVGDTVLFGKWAGSDVKIEGEEYKIMREGDVLARFE